MTMTISEMSDTKQVEFDKHAYPDMVDAYRHEDGSITYIVADNDGSAESPRDYDGNLATLIQRNTRCIDIDSEDASLGEARDRFPTRGGYPTSELMQRYLNMFRPDILHFVDYWSAGDSYGWGYVTREAWVEHMGEHYDGSVTPEQAFDGEVKVYGQWANGEVYGAYHVTVGAPIVIFGDHGAYIDGYETEEDSCWGYLGYDDNQQIAQELTNSPITEVLA